MRRFEQSKKILRTFEIYKGEQLVTKESIEVTNHYSRFGYANEYEEADEEYIIRDRVKYLCPSATSWKMV